MRPIGILLLFFSVLAAALVGVLTHGHVLLIGLPLVLGVPLAGVFGRRRPRPTPRSWRD